MTREQIYVILNEIFRDVFDDESIVVHDGTTADDIEDWDSLEHINLILAIEQQFNVKFSIDEITDMHSVGEMTEFIIEKVNA